MITQNHHHKSVLQKEIIKELHPLKKGIYIDCTFGAGGHTRSLLEADPNVFVIGIDRDSKVEIHAKQIQKDFPNRFVFINAKFGDLAMIIKPYINNNPINGIIYDLGFSSMQVDTPERGFSFKKTGELNMQMGCEDSTAYDIVNHYPESDLANIIFKYGEEKNARRISRAIINYRAKKDIKTTTELADIVKKACNVKWSKTDPATKTFQAIRIEVNNELKELEKSLKNIAMFLKTGAKVCVISFHSLEDRIVKKFLQSQQSNKSNNANIDPFSWIQPEEDNYKPNFISMGKIITPSEEEKDKNPRSRSAKMRVFKKT